MRKISHKKLYKLKIQFCHYLTKIFFIRKKIFKKNIKLCQYVPIYFITKLYSDINVTKCAVVYF